MKLPIAHGRFLGARIVSIRSTWLARRTGGDQTATALQTAANWDNSRSSHSSFRHAFTLIEIVIVAAIIGLMAAMGLPSLDKALRKEGMRKALSDVQDVFFSAREQAIVGNKQVAVVFHPKERSFGVEGASGALNVHSGKAMQATLPEGVDLAMLDIFRQDYVQSDWARIFFNPDGTCDEAVIVLISKGQTEKITLEYATGMPVISGVNQ